MTGPDHTTESTDCCAAGTTCEGESFFVRHACLTGTGDLYGKLKRALRAEMDGSAWATLYSSTSCPFDRLTAGRIAARIVNHSGDEVLRVYEVEGAQGDSISNVSNSPRRRGS